MSSTIPSAEVFVRHRAEPHISPEEHIARLRLELGRALRGQRAIYLDTRYWIFLRDAALGNARNPVHAALLAELRQQVSAAQLFCPLSASLFAELIKQTVPESRVMTRQLVAELSTGVALCDEQERMEMEITDLLTRGSVRTRLTRRDRVWTRLSFIFGHFYPRDPRFSAEEERVLQKAFTDHLWNRAGTEFMTLEDPGILARHFGGSAQRLNASNAAHVDEVGSFDEVYVAEIVGALDLFAEFATDLIESMMKAEGVPSEEFSPQKRAEHEKAAYSVLVNIARAGKGAISFPTLHLQAKCHAAIRRDKQRLLDGNTLLDFHHGLGGIVYCDAFFTERSLMTLLTERPIECGQEFGCRVIADEHAALEYLRALRVQKNSSES